VCNKTNKTLSKVQFAEIEKVSDLDLDLGSRQGHISMRTTPSAADVDYYGRGQTRSE